MNKIIEVKDYEILYRISRLIDKGEFKVNYTADDFFRYLIKEIEETKMLKVFASISPEAQMQGFIIVSVTRDLVRDIRSLFIDLAWVEKSAGAEIGPALLERAEDFAREIGITQLVGYSQKGEKSMLKRYGFDVNYTSYVKPVPAEKKQEGTNHVIRERKERGNKTADSSGAERSTGPVISSKTT